jgi:hypothetical protein
MVMQQRSICCPYMSDSERPAALEPPSSAPLSDRMADGSQPPATQWTPAAVAVSVALFIAAAFAEIGGGWLMWQTLRVKRPWYPACPSGLRSDGFNVRSVMLLHVLRLFRFVCSCRLRHRADLAGAHYTPSSVPLPTAIILHTAQFRYKHSLLHHSAACTQPTADSSFCCLMRGAGLWIVKCPTEWTSLAQR